MAGFLRKTLKYIQRHIALLLPNLYPAFMLDNYAYTIKLHNMDIFLPNYTCEMTQKRGTYRAPYPYFYSTCYNQTQAAVIWYVLIRPRTNFRKLFWLDGRASIGFGFFFFFCFFVPVKIAWAFRLRFTAIITREVLKPRITPASLANSQSDWEWLGDGPRTKKCCYCFLVHRSRAPSSRGPSLAGWLNPHRRVDEYILTSTKFLFSLR